MCVLMCVIASVGLRGWVGGGKELRNRNAFLMGSLFSPQQSTALDFISIYVSALSLFWLMVIPWKLLCELLLMNNNELKTLMFNTYFSLS